MNRYLSYKRVSVSVAPSVGPAEIESTHPVFKHLLTQVPHIMPWVGLVLSFSRFALSNPSNGFRSGASTASASDVTNSKESIAREEERYYDPLATSLTDFGYILDPNAIFVRSGNYDTGESHHAVDDTDAQLTHFFRNLGDFLPASSQARGDAGFWKKPEFVHFRKWVSQLDELSIDPKKQVDFKKSINSILETFYHFPAYQECVSSICVNSGCGDLKAVLYIQLKTALPLYNERAKEENFAEIEKASKLLHAIQFAIKNISQRAMHGDHAEHILSVLVDPDFKSKFEGNYPEILMARPYLGVPSQIKKGVVEETGNEVDQENYLKEMVFLPVFSSLHARAKVMIEKSDEAAITKGERQWNPKLSDHENAEMIIGIKRAQDRELAMKLRVLLTTSRK